MSQVRLEIYGERGVITAETLVAAVQRTLKVLRELDRTSRGGDVSRGHWRVNEVWNGSIGLALEPSADIAAEVPLRLVGGLTVLEERPELPQWFSESAIENVQKLGRILADPGVTGLGLAAVGDDGAQTEARVTPVVVQHASEAFQGTDEALGSVAGVLDVVNLRRGQHTVSLYDPEERHAVRCNFPADLLETVRAYLGSPVRATGAITRNRVGQVAAVKAESLEQLEVVGEVPTVAELTGAAPWVTGGRDSVEYQQWTRGA
ncbi:MAG: hypothetical protein ACRD0Z_08150 [Acidimicrobiales bacterium]